MDVGQANQVIDRLNNVFQIPINGCIGQQTTDIPSACELYEALVALKYESDQLGGAQIALPTGINPSSIDLLNKEIALVVDQIRRFANSVIEAAKCKANLEAQLLVSDPALKKLFKL